MKNYLLLTLSLLCFLPIKAQIEFAPVGATYYYLQETQFGFDAPLTPNIHEIIVIGDTIIQEQLCSILQGSVMNWPCNNEENKIFMYQDSGRVYYFRQDTETFDLLYDFNKNAGEWWEVPAFCTQGPGCGFHLDFTVMVDSVTYRDLNGFSVKVQHTTLSNEDGIIDYADIYEGLGDLEHLFFEEPWYCTTAHDWIRGLRCYDSPTDGLFTFFEDQGSCDMLVATDEAFESKLLDIKIAPNPVNRIVQISKKGYFSWKLYDVHGQLMSSKTNNYNESKIDMAQYSKGIYFLQIQQHSTNKIVVKRIVRQ